MILLEPNKESAVHKLAHSISMFHKKTFSITGLPENIVEYYASGFAMKDIKYMLAYFGMTKVYSYTTGILPTWFPLPRIIIKNLLALERLIQRLPLLKGQLGSILILAFYAK